jgi:outer membrane lipoprotein SlyB
MFTKARKAVVGVAALAALALGGAALSDAATSGSTSSSSARTAAPPQGYGPPPQGGAPRGPHVGANGKQEQALTGETAAKVKAAAEKKVAGGTIERVETDVDTGSPYEAHVRKSDGSEVVVYVNRSFEVTSVDSMQHP